MNRHIIVPGLALLLAAPSPSSARPAAPAAASQEASQSVPAATMVTLAELPAGLHRRAADILEERRDLDASPWVDAALRDAVVPMFRPGEQTPAYVELTVVGPDGAPRGYMVLSTGEHDHPIVELSHEGPAPSERVQAKLAEGTLPARYYRLSYDATVAEDAQGNLLAYEGYLPGKVSGYDPAWLDLPDSERSGHYQWDPAGGVTERRAAVGESVRFDAWDSWRTLVAEYADNYAPLHALDRRNAAEAWQAERIREANGGTLQNKEFRELPLLSGRGSATFSARGAGASAVRIEQGERAIEGDEALRVFVDTAPVGEVAPLDIDVRYDDGSKETLRLNVTDSIPNHVFGRAAPTATGGTVRLRMRPVDAPNIACSKAVVVTERNSAIRVSGTTLSTTGPWRTSDAIMRIEYPSPGKIAFRASTGKYWRAAGAGGAGVAADRTQRLAHEEFTLFTNRGQPEYYGLQTADRRHVVTFSDGGDVHARGVNAGASKFKVDYCQPTIVHQRWAGNNVADAHKKVRKYAQLGAHMAPSTSQCASGCAATAWAMLFGFHDYEASTNVPRWTSHKGLYKRDGKATGPDAVAPEWMWDGHHGSFFSTSTPLVGPAAITWELSQILNDFVLAGCAPNGEKWTAPVEMGKAHVYLERRNINATLVSDYDGASIMTHEGKTKAYAVIKNKQPVVIGIGHLSHYPLAVGRDRSEYRVWERDNKRWSSKADRRHFVVSMGWGRPSLQTVPYDTWMVGSLKVANTAIGTPAVANPKKPKNTHLPTHTTVKPIPHKKPKFPGPGPIPNF